MRPNADQLARAFAEGRKIAVNPESLATLVDRQIAGHSSHASLLTAAIAAVPLRYGYWKHIKRLYKHLEARSESVELTDLLRDETVAMTKVMASDPLSIGGSAGSIRDRLVERTEGATISHAWEAAIRYTATRFRELQEKYGRKAIGGITSSRCAIEEVYVVQQLIRAGFHNNNVDTCARVCHSPTGYGLKQTLGTSAGTQPFNSVEEADVILLIGANPTDGHPVFASQMKQAIRKGAKIIVVDPRRIDLVRSPHIQASYHLPLQPGTNVPIINALAHVAIKEGLIDQDYIDERCDLESFVAWKKQILKPENSPEMVAEISGVPADVIRGAARLYAGADNGAIYYGLGVSEHSQGSTMVMGMANLAGPPTRTWTGTNPMRRSRRMTRTWTGTNRKI